MDVQKAPSEEPLERVRSSISPEELRAQVERICRSDAFDGQTNCQKLLTYLVDRAIQRHIPTPREIAREALGRQRFERGASDVRVTMKTLREKLDEYYEKEAKDDDIWLDIPERQYNVFWKHSPKTLLGQTEFGGWVLWSAKLTAEGAKRAAETSKKFWPHLASVFPVYCAEEFSATLDKGKITLPDTVKMFFNSIGNYHLFITSFDRSEIRLYPLNVWLEEWARLKSSEEFKSGLNVYEFWGQSAEIENKAEVIIHSNLLNALNLPEHEPFHVKLSFHPDGFISFDVPKPLPRPTGKYNLYVLSSRTETDRFYYYVLVGPDKEKPLEEALAGLTPFDIKSYGYIIAEGRGYPPEGMRDRLLSKYNAVLASNLPA